ncbi:aquaporin family protein [Nocardioides eburneiflavus]|uniref:Aquaporin family protein n=1 Tax=Nocardioides eburneiflavus TaxID=2518372 RepID=A0A4Z1BPY3_9ACTN|nr:aquaporin [Nocardioides eburneiflavus]TGN63391.1 aquaporin family protein [Nocardioides eburneiflavus]
MTPGLTARATAELVGTALLVAAVVGSGVMATRLTDDVGLQLLANSLATGAVLVALIVSLQPVSAAFNPVVTAAEAVLRLVRPLDAAVLVGAQVAGGAIGAMLANVMFDLDVITLAGRERTGVGLWTGEVVATLGLVLVVFGCARAGRTDAIAWAVAGWIVAAYWFTSSTSFANPAVTIARTLSDTFAGISPASAPMFVLMQLVGGGVALGLLRVLHPIPSPLEAVRD